MELTLEGMKNAHVEPSYRSGRSFWGGIPVSLVVARTCPGGIFSTSTQTVALLFYMGQRRSMSANNFYNQIIDWCCQAGASVCMQSAWFAQSSGPEAGCTMHQIVAITGHGSLAEVARYTRATE